MTSTALNLVAIHGLVATVIVLGLSLAGLAVTCLWVLYRRLPRPDTSVGFETARLIIDAYNSGATDNLDGARQAVADAAFRAQQARNAQQWNPHADLDATPEDDAVTIGEFGTHPAADPDGS